MTCARRRGQDAARKTGGSCTLSRPEECMRRDRETETRGETEGKHERGREQEKHRKREREKERRGRERARNRATEQQSKMSRESELRETSANQRTVCLLAHAHLHVV